LTKLEKPDNLVLYFRTSGFGGFKVKTRKELNMKIQGCLKHEKGKQGFKGPRDKEIQA
jgi:hypothetical protein